MPRPALVLIAHGSPDPDWRAPIERLGARLRELAPQRTVEVAYLDFAAPTLAEVAQRLVAAGLREAVVVPAFLSPGGRHIKQDIPALVLEVGAQHPALTLRLVRGALGADAGVIDALAAATLRFAAAAEDGTAAPDVE